MSNGKTVHEPLFHISKRAPLSAWKAWLIRMGAVVAAIILSSLLIIGLTGQNPVGIFNAAIKGAFGDVSSADKGSGTRWELVREWAILLSIAVAVTPAFKMKFWNIGAEGQALFGALAAAVFFKYCGSGFLVSDFGKVMLILIMVALGFVAGAVWALIPAIFKAKWNTNETLFTLMMNYIAVRLVSVFLITWDPDHKSFIISDETFSLMGNKYAWLVGVALVITVIMFVYFKFSKHGYEISVVGESKNTAKYIGINVTKITLRTLILSGGLCGLIGGMLVIVKSSLGEGLIGGYGFTAILVSWLAKFNPLFMILTSFLVVFLQKGSSGIADAYQRYNISKDFGDILVGIIFLFIIGCEFFLTFAIKKRKKKKEMKDE